MSCMADYGAPVFPFLAVGGYEGEGLLALHFTHEITVKHVESSPEQKCVCLHPDDAYTSAEALILTFSLNNYARSNPKFKVAMQWEKEFLKIVQDYQNSPSTNFTFAYMAEVCKSDCITL